MVNKDHDSVGDEILRELLDGGAQPRDLTPLPGQSDRAEAALERIMALPRDVQSDPAAPVRPVRPRRTRLLRGAVVASVAAAAIVVVTVALPQKALSPLHAATPALLTLTGVKTGTLPSSGFPAGDRLRALAALADAQPAPAALPVQHIVLSSWWATSGGGSKPVPSELIPVDHESFFEPNGQMRVIERRGKPLNSDSRLSSTSGGSTVSDDSFLSADPGPGYADRLPTDPARLSEFLVSNEDPHVCVRARGGCLVSDLTDLFQNYVVSPRVTGALWRVLADQPSITYLGETYDRLNRPAEVFTAKGEDGFTQKLLLISPTTGQYLGEEDVLITRSPQYTFEPPAVISFSALVRAERVSASSVPAPRK